MTTRSNTFNKYPEGTFALGSSQYAGIYRKYKELSKADKNTTTGFDPSLSYRQTITNFFEEIIPAVKEGIVENARDWGEEPKLEDWSSLDLKLKLLQAGESTVYDLQKRILLDYFNLLKNQAWDLWSALTFTIDSYPELSEFLESNGIDRYEEDDEMFGLSIYFFSVILKLDDDEVIEIFGDFDT